VGVEIERIRAQGKPEKQLDCGEAHEAEVTTFVEVIAAGKDLGKFGTSLCEGANGQSYEAAEY
jgi:hypothetical protein